MAMAMNLLGGVAVVGLRPSSIRNLELVFHNVCFFISLPIPAIRLHVRAHHILRGTEILRDTKQHPR
jgi:hypothetical protein